MLQWNADGLWNHNALLNLDFLLDLNWHADGVILNFFFFDSAIEGHGVGAGLLLRHANGDGALTSFSRVGRLRNLTSTGFINVGAELNRTSTGLWLHRALLDLASAVLDGTW